MIEAKFVQRIAEEISVGPGQVAKAIELLDGGATIPFVARYRKDVTGNLDEVKLEAISDRNAYFRSLQDRRQSVLDSIAKQEKLTDELKARIEACYDKTTLEDLYLPFKPKRQTKATIAREKGLEPLAEYIWAQKPGGTNIETFAAVFIRPEVGISTLEEALEGARHILAERISEDADARALLRTRMMKEGKVTAHATKNSEGKKTKFETYYNFTEAIASIPSHRFLAVLRGSKEGMLRMELAVDDESFQADLLGRYLQEPGSMFDAAIREAVEDAYKRHLRPSIENEVIGMARERADLEAIRVFRENAENLLLSPPAGQVSTIGVDPGMRTGCKLAAVDKLGDYKESVTVFPNPPQNDLEGAEKALVELMEKYEANAVAIGNGTGAREAAQFVKAALAKLNRPDAFSVFVNEAGASVYSASKIAREEFPDLDVTIRGAISIARRLQDPLAELVKIEPRHVGVGQYQHDVNQKELREGLQQTVVSCVNHVGVDLNSASFALLRYVSGIQANTATNIVAHRTKIGGFTSRKQLMEVDGIGPKVFEQCAGFLRVRSGETPLDATGIHPEAYPVVERIAESVGATVEKIIQDPAVLREIDMSAFADDTIGTLTLEDIRSELAKPARDPRREFKVPKFLDGISDVKDLEDGMEMEGVVTNVTDFGAFVDIGVHQDGLVHRSELANRFVRDPRDVVKVGEIVRIKVIKVDKDLPRISLSMKALMPPPAPRRSRREGQQGPRRAPAAVGAPEGQAPQGDRPPRPEGVNRRREGQQQDRGPRPPQREGERRDRPPRRDDRRDDRRPERQEGRGRRPEKQHQRDNRPAGRGHQTNEGEKINTLLADQLAALRDKFNS
ncbi:MAG: Tex-like N-terminal domain-containing protein [FCB group bacterium]|jgi:uncharacterized protein|nr:Tex-like N-terminal domain-containing protein [FCB group bacterium]